MNFPIFKNERLSQLVKAQLDVGSRRDRLNSFVTDAKRFFKSPKSYRIIIPFVLACTLLSHFNIGIPIPFHIKEETILKLLNDRISDFLSIFAIAVAISVFVIQSIQSARLGEEQFSTIFRESGLYPFLYFALISLGIMNIVSFLQDEISSSSITNNTVFHGMIIFAVALLFIGILFKRIYDFLNTKYLLNAYISNLKYLSEKELHKQVEERLSRTILYDKFKELGFDIINLNSEDNVGISFDRRVVLKDVNITGLRKSLSDIGEFKGSFSLLGIHDVINPNEPVLLFSPNIKLNPKKIKQIKRQFKTVPFKDDFNEFITQKELLVARLISAASTDDSRSASTIFSALLGIFETFMESAEKLKIEKKPNRFAEKHIFDRYWRVIDNLYRGIYFMLEKAAVTNSRRITNEIFSFNSSLLILAIQRRSTIVFGEYVNLYLSYYRILTINQKVSEFDDSYIRQLIQILDYRLLHEFSTTRNLNYQEELNILIQKGLAFIASLLKEIIENKDITNFATVIKLVHQAKPDLLFKISDDLTREKWSYRNDKTKTPQDFELLAERQIIISYPIKLYKALLFGIKSWVFQSFLAKNIESLEVIEFLSALDEESNYSFYSTLFNFDDFIELLENEDLLDWSNWDTEEREMGVAYYPLPTETWIANGFVIQLLLSNDSSIMDIDRIKNDEKYIHLLDNDNISYPIKTILDNYEEWESILKIDKAEAELRANKILNLFGTLKSRAEEIKEEVAADAPLSSKKIEEFNKHVFEAWKRTSIIRQVAEHYKLIKSTTNLIDLKGIYSAANFVLWKMKIYFTDREDYSARGFSNFGSSLGRYESTAFINLIFNQCANFKLSQTYEEGLNLIFQNLKVNENKIDILIFNTNRGHKLYGNPNFIPQGRMDSKVPVPFFGEYLGIPCISFNILEHGNFIAAGNLTNNVTLKQGEHPDWFKKELDSSVSDISVTKAHEITADKPDEWIKSSKSETIEETIEKLRKAILVKVGTQLSFEIKDFSHFEIVRISPNE